MRLKESFKISGGSNTAYLLSYIIFHILLCLQCRHYQLNESTHFR